MIKALENNTLGVVLSSVCGGLLLIGLALVAVWALPPSAATGGGDPADDGIDAEIVSLQSARPLDEYSVVSERPVFNETRRPDPVLADGEGEEDLLPIDDVGAPDVELAGVIITPSLRMATLKTKDQQQSLVAFEGKPLEGDFGTWQVSRIQERMVTLADANGEELQLELQVHDAPIKAPPKAARPDEERQAEADTLAANGGESDPESAMTRAEEIRQRIEERREELRRAAEERDTAEAENYRDAIQTMIQRSRQRGNGQQAQEQPGEQQREDQEEGR
ncbi:MAG: hypothetical protein R3212_01995 [Xanthomonadales bacterium]|nr:hypothetical protein [Xanthomonadales bacterium]